MTSEERIILEQQILYLLLNHKDACVDFCMSPYREKHFDEGHRLLLQAIIDAHEHNAVLTMFSYLGYVEKFGKAKKEIISEEVLFNRVKNIGTVKQDDLPFLLEKLRASYVGKMCVESIEEFRRNLETTNEVVAAKELHERVAGAIADVDVTNDVKFELVGSDAFHSQWSAEFKKRFSPDNLIECGIHELDYVMGRGFAAGDLTVIVADVGSFKCVNSCKIRTSDGCRILPAELFRQYDAGLPLPWLQSLSSNGELIAQRLFAVHDNGRAPCIRLRTKLGFEIESTLNHKHLAFDGYREAGSFVVGAHIAIARRDFFGNTVVTGGVPTWLGCLLAEGGCTQSCYGFTNFDASIVRAMRHSCAALNTPITVKRNRGMFLRGQFIVHRCRQLGKNFGIDGKLAIHKSIHESVFAWNRESVVKLLRAMYGCDGSFSVNYLTKKNGFKKPSYRVLYHTSSHQLAKDVRDLLLKFGMVASIFDFQSKFGGHERTAYRVMLQDVRQVERFIKEIGYLGKKQAIAESYLPEMSSIEENSNNDLIPEGVWDVIDRKCVETGKSFYGCRRWVGRPDGKSGRGLEGSCGTRGKPINRFLLRKIAEYLNNDAQLLSIADAEIFWDRIESIDDAGEQQVYDISMPVHHNFVGDSIITHNSTLMLNIALGVYRNAKVDILFVPLEMPRLAVFDKILSRESNVPFKLIQKPVDPRLKTVLLDADGVARVETAREKWRQEQKQGTCGFAFLEMGDRTTVGAIRRQIIKHISILKPRLLVIDYVANLLPDQKRVEGNHLEVGDMLKSMIAMSKPGALTTEGFHVLTAAQLNRSALTRVRNQKDTAKQVLASEDIMGSHHYSMDAANIFGLLLDPAFPKKRIQIFPMKSRWGETVYEDGTSKGVLNVRPEISLITGDKNQMWESSAQEDLLNVWGKDVPVMTPLMTTAGAFGDDEDVEAPVSRPPAQVQTVVDDLVHLSDPPF